jgi:hypothetical protein
MASLLTLAVPFLPDLIRFATPYFTSSKEKDKVPEILVQQISELQTAATQNAEAIKLLAAEMQNTIDALRVGATSLERKLNIALVLSIVSSTTALIAMCVAAYALAK